MAETAKKPVAKTPAAKGAEQVEAAVAAGKETVETVVKASADVATKGVEKAVAMGQEQVEAAAKAGADAFKTYEDVMAFGKDNIDAVVTANTILVKGVQDINKVLFTIARANMDESVAATKKLFGCKSVQDMVALQSDMIKDGYAKGLDESKKIAEMGSKLAEEASKPLTERVTVVVETVTKQVAA